MPPCRSRVVRFLISFYSNPSLRCHSSLFTRPLPILLFRLCLELSVPLLPVRMGRKRTAEDYRRTAEENGWVAGTNEEEDSVQ